MSFSQSSGASGWQSDDEPPCETLGDFFPLAVSSRGKASVVKKLLTLGTQCRSVGSEDAVLMSMIELDCGWGVEDVDFEYPLPEKKNYDVKDLKEHHPEVALALRFMKLGERCVVFSNGCLGDKSPKGQHQLERLRRHFVRIQAEDRTNVYQKMESDLRSKYIVYLDQVELKMQLADTTAYRVISKATTSWQTARTTSRMILNLWRGELTDSTGDEALERADASLQRITISICDCQCASVSCLLSCARVDETSKVVWNDQVQQACAALGWRGDPAPVMFVHLEEVHTDTVYSLSAAHELTEPVNPASRALPSPGGADLVVTQIIRNDRTLNHLRSTGTMQPQAGTLLAVAVRFGQDPEEVIGITVSRTSEIPLWFHELLKKLRLRFTYEISMCGDFEGAQCVGNYLQACSEADECGGPCAEAREIAEARASAVSERSPEIASFRALRCTGSCRDCSAAQSGGVENLHLVGLAEFAPFVEPVKHKCLCDLDKTYAPTYKQVYKLQIPEDLELYHKNLNLDHVGRESFDVNRFQQKFRATIVGEISQEPSPWDFTVSTGLGQYLALLSLSLARLSSGQEVWARKLAEESIEYLRHVGSRKLEPEDMKCAQECYGEKWIEPSKWVITEDIIPTVKNLAPKLYHTLMNAAIYYAATLNSRDNKRVIETLTTIEEEYLEPDILKKCRMMKARAYLELKEFEKCTEACAGDPSLSAYFQLATKGIEEDLVKQKNLYKRMFG